MDVIIPAIIGLIIFIAIFIALREFFCWYGKINESLKIQKLNTFLMAKLLEKNGGAVDWDEINNLIR